MFCKLTGVLGLCSHIQLGSLSSYYGPIILISPPLSTKYTNSQDSMRNSEKESGAAPLCSWPHGNQPVSSRRRQIGSRMASDLGPCPEVPSQQVSSMGAPASGSYRVGRKEGFGWEAHLPVRLLEPTHGSPETPWLLAPGFSDLRLWPGKNLTNYQRWCGCSQCHHWGDPDSPLAVLLTSFLRTSLEGSTCSRWSRGECLWKV